MFGPLGGPRLLLRRLREVMAEPISPQDRLDKIVTHIAANMVAEVCSVYVLRADGRLELFATEGLNREAVHLTTMRAGEGLVGLIAETAEPLALADAPEARMERPNVVFEDLVSDCNVGNEFWNGKIFTLDIPERVMYLAPPS